MRNTHRRAKLIQSAVRGVNVPYASTTADQKTQQRKGPIMMASAP